MTDVGKTLNKHIQIAKTLSIPQLIFDVDELVEKNEKLQRNGQRELTQAETYSELKKKQVRGEKLN